MKLEVGPKREWIAADDTNAIENQLECVIELFLS
jgi:hypothetical protein